MKTNFEIEENYAVRFNELHIDLHNNFDFVGVSKTKKDLSIGFIQAEGDWIKEDELKSLSFEFENISYEYYEDGDSEAPKEDKKRLEEISFLSSEAREINNGIILQSKPTDKDDLIFVFGDGKVIRIGCQKVNLSVKK